MTATQADMRVLAVGRGPSWRALVDMADGKPLVATGADVVLCEMPGDSAAALHVGAERDWCTPGAWSGVVFALAEAGIAKAGAAGVAELHRREVTALRRANALAEAVQSIGQALKDALRDCAAEPGREGDIATIALCAVEAIVCSVAADLGDPTGSCCFEDCPSDAEVRLGKQLFCRYHAADGLLSGLPNGERDTIARYHAGLPVVGGKP